MSCQELTVEKVQEEQYLFAAQANQELAEWKQKYELLLERYTDLEVQFNLLEKSLDRSIDIMVRMERDHASQK